MTRSFLNFTYAKKLPDRFGGGSILVTPRSDVRGLYPDWKRSALDLMLVAEGIVKPGMGLFHF